MIRSYVVGLGSNVEPFRTLEAALRVLVSRFGTLELSRVVETAPAGPMNGTLLNAAALIRSDMPEPELKALLRVIEAELGRDRSHPDPAGRDRTIDLGILLSLPPFSAGVDASLLPEEPCYRPLVLELLHTVGLPCTVPAPGTTGATAITFGGQRIGLEPARLVSGRRGGPVIVQPRRAAFVTGGAPDEACLLNAAE